MKTRVLHTRFWKDEYISNLSQIEKLLFIYLLSNDQINMCGIYELPDKYIKADLDLDQDQLNNIKNKLMDDGKIIFSGSWIKIVNHNKYNSYGKGMQEKALDKELSQVPPYILDTSINTSIHTRHNTENRNKKSEIRNKKTEIQEEKVDINSLIEKFEPINPSYKTLYANITQRKALERMVKEHGFEKVEKMIMSLPQIVTRPYAPKITTPLTLETKLGELVIFIKQEGSKQTKGGVFDARGL